MLVCGGQLGWNLLNCLPQADKLAFDSETGVFQSMMGEIGRQTIVAATLLSCAGHGSPA